MLDPQTEKLAKSLVRELWARRNTWVLLALLVSVAALTVGLYLPKKYTATASVLVESNNIVGPLMDGVAEQTNVADMASIISELVFSRSLLERILREGGWPVDNMSPAGLELEMQRLMLRTHIANRGRDLIELDYTDIDPERAYLVTKMYVDWIIEESRESKRRESMRAFEFIEGQVGEYQQKLVAVENQLNQFRSENMDALPESAAQVSDRAMQLRREIESLRLQLSELQSREATLQQQLSGETETLDNQGKASEYRARLAELQNELDTLRLNYHDTYPDIIRIKGQIVDLEHSIQTGRSIGSVAGSREDSAGESQINPLYSELRVQLSGVRTEQSGARTRLRDLESLLQKEIERSQKIGLAESQLSELSRDYEVNNDIYQDLLRRRERARVSMSMDEQDQGLTMKIQEPPVVPQSPSGLRFMHIMLGGLLFSLAIPIIISAAFVQFDPRLRMKEQFESLKLPVLAVVAEMQVDTRQRATSNLMFAIGIFSLAGLYAVFAWMRLQGVGG